MTSQSTTNLLHTTSTTSSKTSPTVHQNSPTKHTAPPNTVFNIITCDQNCQGPFSLTTSSHSLTLCIARRKGLLPCISLQSMQGSTCIPIIVSSCGIHKDKYKLFKFMIKATIIRIILLNINFTIKPIWLVLGCQLVYHWKKIKNKIKCWNIKF